MFHYTATKEGIGVTVRDVDLSLGLSSSQLLQIQDLLNRFRVVTFKKQTITDEQLKDFAFCFGPPFIPDKKFPVLGSQDSEDPIVIVGNRADEFTRSYLGHQEVLPHSDHQWLKFPSSASMLYAVDVNEAAAPTIWFDMVKAYQLLESEIKAEINGLKSITYNPFYRPFGTVSASYVDRKVEIPPGEVFAHPLIRTHPVTREKILYLNVAYELELLGVSYENGSDLVARMQKHILGLKNKYEHRWENGDLVFWDNRATIHYRPKFDSEVRRVLKRITIGGEKPF